MEVILAFVGIWFIILLKIAYEEIQSKKRLRIRLQEQYGKNKKVEYTSERLESIKKYYESIQDDKHDIDDITWNDVDMDEIFASLSNTSTSIGEEYLYALLRKVQYDDTRLKRIDEMADYFKDHEEERLNLQIQFSKMGHMNRISVYEYINVFDDFTEVSPLKHIFQAVGLLVTISVIPFNVPLGVTLSLIMVATNMVTYFKVKQTMEPYFQIINYIARMIGSVEQLSKTSCKMIEPNMVTMLECTKKLRAFKFGASIVGRGNGDLIDVIMDYFRMLFHIDLIQFCRLSTVFHKYRKELNCIYENIGFIDSAIAISSFRAMLPYYSKPVLVKGTKPEIKVKEIYHVMVENPVDNSLNENRSVLITGSNASGKSTFIKALAINAILSQTIFTSLSKEYHANYFSIASSMALSDNISAKESYYIVEIKSLKRIVDRVDPDIPLLCFVDEILRGTNTLERIAASSEILNNLGHANVLCFAATHDIELTHILEDCFSNYHFQEQIVDNNILFDYKLYEGRAVSKNAIKLLNMIKGNSEYYNLCDSILFSANFSLWFKIFLLRNFW